MMKGKRLLSLVLALIMAVTGLTGSFYAFAAEAPSDYNFAQEVKAFRTTPINRYAIDGIVVWTEEGIQNALDGTWDSLVSILSMVVDIDFSRGLNAALEEMVYQPETIKYVFQFYANLSHDEDYGDLFYSFFNSEIIADYLEQDDDKFAGAVEKIRAITVTEEEAAEGINDLDKLLEIEFTDQDFGFTAGDKQGFIDAMLGAVRPVTFFISDDCTFFTENGIELNMFDTADDDGNTVQGIYSLLIPILEQLGLNDLPFASDYKANYFSVKSARGANVAYDELIRPIVESVMKNIVQPIADEPFNGLVVIIPRLSYVLDSGILNDTVQSVIRSLGEEFAEAAASISITSDMVNDMLMNVELDLSEQVGEECYIRLKPVNFDVLADCATVQVVPSHSNSNQYVMVRTGEADSCFTNVFYYVYDLMFTDKVNYNTVKAVLRANMDGITLASMLVRLNKMASQGKYKAYSSYLDTTGEKGDTPIAPYKSDVQNKFVDLDRFKVYDDYTAYTSVYNSFITGANPPIRNKFSPEDTITRAMFVTILYRMAGSPYDNGNNPYGSKSPFNDIRDTSVYYYNAACWALDNDITNQITFKPYDNVSREQTAAFLYRYAEANDMLGGPSYKTIKLTDYPDNRKVSEWAVEPMKWANCNGMITGTQQGYLNPQGATLRIHASKILYGFGKACRVGNFK